MLGIIFTVVAVLLVICFAFCYADHPVRGGPDADALFHDRVKGIEKNLDRVD